MKLILLLSSFVSLAIALATAESFSMPRDVKQYYNQTYRDEIATIYAKKFEIFWDMDRLDEDVKCGKINANDFVFRMSKLASDLDSLEEYEDLLS